MTPPRRTVAEASALYRAANPPPSISEADIAAIAAKVVEALKPAKPLHEMSDMERDAYANEVWARAGIFGGKTK